MPRATNRQPWTEPRCGRCGYCVWGAPSFVCPECGSDLREVGIVARRRVGGMVWGALWTVLLPIPALFLWALFYNTVAPRVHTVRYDRVIECKYDYDPVGTLRVQFDGEETVWGPRPFTGIPLRRLTLWWEDRPASALVVELPARNQFVAPVVPPTRVVLDRDVLRPWIEKRSALFYESQLGSRALLDAIEETPWSGNRETVDHGGQYKNKPSKIYVEPTDATATVGIAPWAKPGAAVIGISIWLIGLVVIRRRFSHTIPLPAASVITPVAAVPAK